MLDRIEEFAALLRSNGVRVSTAEVIDAARALRAVGLSERGKVRAALSASLIKRAGDRPTFDQLFELYFARGQGLAGGSAGDLGALLADAGLGPDEIAALLERLASEAMSMPAVARMGMGMGSPEMVPLIEAAAREAQLDRIRSPLQVGYYSYRMSEALGLDGARAQLSAMLDRMLQQGVIDPEMYARLAELIAGRLDQLRRAVRDYVQDEFDRQNLDYMQELTARTLSEKPLAQLTDDEVDSLRREVRRLAEVLRARVSLKPVVERRGRLDLRRTLRRSLATGGVPFELIRRRRQRRKPRLVVLCDVSDSVRNVSRFMLQLVYALQELFDRVESFAFVAELGELSELFRTHDIDRALQLTYSGAVVNVFANSNYGNSLRQFAARHMDLVTARTTVLVLGDGRNNYHASHGSVLGDIRRRAKQVWWLNPESPAAWGFGDSAMHEYEPHCDRVVVVYNLDSLRQVVDELVM